jgi:hypothetical protein
MIHVRFIGMNSRLDKTRLIVRATMIASALAFMVVAATGVTPPKQTITKEMVLDAIMTFRVDPLSDDARQAGALVMLFTDQSHDVIVKLRDKTLPFLLNKSLPEKHRLTLLEAFVVGNVDSQLLRHQTKDDSYAGVLQMIDSYRQMQHKNPKLRIKEVERFIDMQSRGELKAYVSS